jgi:two-component system sensor histidine kinase DctS
VEQDLADALAFRKAMEDSLVTGLRARDLQGRTTYVNPAFCQMVGFSAEELLGTGARRRTGRPSWRRSTASARQVRLAGGTRRRAKASNRCSCARTARASRC